MIVHSTFTYTSAPACWNMNGSFCEREVIAPAACVRQSEERERKQNKGESRHIHIQARAHSPIHEQANPQKRRTITKQMSNEWCIRNGCVVFGLVRSVYRRCFVVVFE